jgi:hypothetical protein
MGARTRKPKAKAAATDLETNGRPATELLPPPVDDNVIDEVAEKLNELTRLRGLELAAEMGKVVIDNFFDGDLEAYRSRGIRDASLRKLAKHPKLGISPTTLYRSIETFALSDRLGNPEWKNLTTSHVRAVLGLKEEDQQKLLTQAEDKGWTAQQLQTQAAKSKKKIADGRGRPPLPRFQKSLQQMGKFFADPDDSFGDTEKLDELEDDVALSLFKTVTDAKSKIDELQKQLQKRVRGLDV